MEQESGKRLEADRATRAEKAGIEKDGEQGWLGPCGNRGGGKERVGYRACPLRFCRQGWQVMAQAVVRSLLGGASWDRL